MRIVFMGTPNAAVPSLERLVGDHDVCAVYTRPSRPRGRGRAVRPTPVHVEAERLGLHVVEPGSLRRPEEQERLRSFAPDVITVVAFGQILPPAVLALPQRGCVNVHFSLLPRWRGAAPVERAILAGDDETGVATMLMDEGLDTGPVLLTHVEPIRADDTSGTLTARLAVAGADLLARTLDGLASGRLEPLAQPEEGVTYAEKVDPAEATLDWSTDAETLTRTVRAFNPTPGAHATFRGRRLKVLRAVAVPGDGAHGSIVAVDGDRVDVQTGDGRLRLEEVQLEGKRPMTVHDFVNGYRPTVGETMVEGGAEPTSA